MSFKLIQVVSPKGKIPVRAKPSTTATQLRLLSDGDQIRVDSETKTGFFVLANDEGYVNKSTKGVDWKILTSGDDDDDDESMTSPDIHTFPSTESSLTSDLQLLPRQEDYFSTPSHKFHKLTKDETSVLISEFDTDKNGKLTADELDSAITKFKQEKLFGTHVISEEARHIIQKYDWDENGQISKDEKEGIIKSLAKATNLKLSEDEIEFLIQHFDTDKSGTLSEYELNQIVVNYKCRAENSITASMCIEDYAKFRTIVEKFDADKDGKIDTEELTEITEEIKNEKIPVWVSMNTSLQGIDMVEQSFTVDGWINFFWCDPDLPNKQSVEKGFTIEDDGENIPINVGNMFENAFESSVLGGPFYKYDPKNRVVSMAIHFKATFSEFLELEKFPFDRQFLTMRICVRTKEFHVLSEPPDYVPSRLNLRSLASYTYSSSVTGYDFLSPVIGHCKAPNHSDDLRMTVSFRVDREPTYFLINIVLPIFMIVSITPVTFAIEPDSIAERMGIILALLLTMITFKFVISEQTPKISTMTLLDKYIVMCYCLFLATTVQTLVLYICIDRAYWNIVNFLSGVIFETVWIAFHLVILYFALKKSFCVPWEDMKDEENQGKESIDVKQADINVPPKYY